MVTADIAGDRFRYPIPVRRRFSLLRCCAQPEIYSSAAPDNAPSSPQKSLDSPSRPMSDVDLQVQATTPLAISSPPLVQQSSHQAITTPPPPIVPAPEISSPRSSTTHPYPYQYPTSHVRHQPPVMHTRRDQPSPATLWDLEKYGKHLEELAERGDGQNWTRDFIMWFRHPQFTQKYSSPNSWICLETSRLYPMLIMVRTRTLDYIRICQVRFRTSNPEFRRYLRYDFGHMSPG